MEFIGLARVRHERYCPNTPPGKLARRSGGGGKSERERGYILLCTYIDIDINLRLDVSLTTLTSLAVLVVSIAQTRAKKSTRQKSGFGCSQFVA